MKKLIISSGNNIFGISPIVKSQGESLKDNGLKLEYFTIKGKGLIGYLKNIFLLKTHLNQYNYDIIHAHYSLSAMVASLAGANPLIVSLMGSDTQANWFIRVFIRLFNAVQWCVLIVKSQRMAENLRVSNPYVIPNGVDFSLFKPISQSTAREKIGFENGEKYILFISNIERYEKNYTLAQKAISLLKDDNVILKPVFI